MDGKIVNFDELQEEHLDMMIRLAFDQEDAEAVQQILDAPEPELTAQEEEISKRAWASAQAKVDAIEKDELHAKRLKGLKRAAPRILQAAACLILVFSIAMPIAVASSAEFRAKVMQLLVSIDNEHNAAHFSYVEDTDASFVVPEGWTGEYFTSFIPEGMEAVKQSQYLHSIEYADKAGKKFSFAELDADAGVAAGTENATISYADINGASACVIDGYAQDGTTHIVTVVWANDAKWFALNCNNIEPSDALMIAKGVKKII